ncbi:hypothetical protein IJT17_00545 [bacterium]|nr:hypothetical protein [bacterium]
MAAGESYLSWRSYSKSDHKEHNVKDMVRDRLEKRRRGAVPTRASKHSALVVGCSFTYGIGVRPEECFVYQLNELMQEWSFTNAGIPGSGAYVALTAMRQEMEKKPFDLVIYAPIANHIYRYTNLELGLLGRELQPQDQSNTDIYPIYIGSHLNTVCYNYEPTQWYGDNSLRIINFLRQAFQYSEKYYLGPGAQARDELCFSFIVRTMYTYCQLHGSKFAAIGLYGFGSNGDNRDGMRYLPTPLLQLTQAKLISTDIPPAIPTWDVSYPQDIMLSPELHTKPRTTKRNSSITTDRGDHPSPLVHRYYAQKIAEIVRSLEAAPAEQQAKQQAEQSKQKPENN